MSLKFNYSKLLKISSIPVLLLLLTSCSNTSQTMVKVDLTPVPYLLEVPSKIAKHLSIENMITNIPNEFTNQAVEAGALAQIYINYRADDGTMHGFAGIYYFKKTDYEKAQNPNEPPLYGSKVLEDNSMVLLVQGPQDSIFDPNSQDGENSMELYRIIYQPFSYKALK
jgi:hypothetical protein